MNSRSTKTYKLLVIDDEPSMVDLQSLLLKNAGHDVVALQSTEDALSKTKEYAPDCVLTDIMMPGIDGLQLLKQIRDEPELSATKVIIVSAKTFEYDQRAAMQLGADSFITKPLDADSFAGMVEDILADRMQMSFWGVRGTLPVSGQRSLRYGGNTSCVSLDFPRGQQFIFDAGSGIKEYSNALMAAPEKMNAKIFISHPHWDHINALPFFVPLYIPGNEFEVLGGAHAHITMRELIAAQMEDVYFPITMKEFGSRVYFRDLNEGDYEIDGISVKTMRLSYPGNCLGYRIDYGGHSFCYITDNELFLPGDASHNAHYVKTLTEFVAGADALITDATYTDAEYSSKIGWGHSCISQVVNLAHEAAVKTLYLFHHDPDQNDDAIDAKHATAAAALNALQSSTQLVSPIETLSVKI
jgi:phosphoribosyl 1,2-cyclic phosphodiesterase/ActR/RegA family two-component response regulator